MQCSVQSCVEFHCCFPNQPNSVAYLRCIQLPIITVICRQYASRMVNRCPSNGLRRLNTEQCRLFPDVYPAPVISHPAAAPPPPPVEPANQLAAHAVPNPATGGTTMDPHQQQGTSFSNSSYVDSDSRDSATRINMSAL